MLQHVCDLSCCQLTHREPLLFVIALCESYRVSVGWANPTSENFNTLRVSAASSFSHIMPLLHDSLCYMHCCFTSLKC